MIGKENIENYLKKNLFVSSEIQHCVFILQKDIFRIGVVHWHKHSIRINGKYNKFAKNLGRRIHFTLFKNGFVICLKNIYI